MNPTATPTPGETTIQTTPDDQRFAAALGRLVSREIDREDLLGLGENSLEGWGEEQVVHIQIPLDVTEYTAIALSFTEDMPNIPVERVRGGRGLHPVWGVLETPEGNLPYLLSVTMHLRAGELGDFECLLTLMHASQTGYGDNSHLKLAVLNRHADSARAWVAERRERASRDHDPLRGRVVELYFSGGDLYPRIVAAPARENGGVVVDEAILEEIDRNVTGHLEAREILSKAGLGCNRGILLYGPPGTGKTSLVRDIIGSTAGKATVLIPESGVAAEALGYIYRDAVRLSPAVVVLEDVDAVAGRRGHRTDTNLAGFLNALDGVVQDERSLVITVATTNDPAGIDDAAKRPGRIDKFIEVPLPDRQKRERILAGYLQRLGAGGIENRTSEETVRHIANAADGASGALLKEVVRRALLIAHRRSTSGGVEDQDLQEAAGEIGYRVESRNGQYL
jgi:Cdc6-like AAA superfamily ATPase